MPLKSRASTEYTTAETPSNRGVLRRLNPMIFLTICCTLFILIIIAALIVFTFLPIFTSAKGNQTKYQIQSDVLILTYDLPDRLSILPINLTYIIDELESSKLSILQKLLQDQLDKKRITRKTSITVMDAFITRQNSSSIGLQIISPVSINEDNNTVIVITQPANSTATNSSTQLIISLMLRYALECAKTCQNNLKDSIFVKTFHSLELSIEDFRILLTEELKTPIYKLFSISSSSSTSSTTTTTTTTTSVSCIVSTPSSILTASIIMTIAYEAESSLNTFISSTIQSCSICSGEQKVANIGFTSELIFQQITSLYGGSTLILFHYTTDRIRSAEIIVNGILPSIKVTFPLLSLNQNVGSLPIVLNLCQGFNSIRIYNPYNYTPDFDRIIVY